MESSTRFCSLFTRLYPPLPPPPPPSPSLYSRYQTDVLDKLGFKGTFAEFVATCHAPESGYYFDTKEDLLAEYDVLKAKIETKLGAYFDEFPSSSLEIVAKDSETAPAAYVFRLELMRQFDQMC